MCMRMCCGMGMLLRCAVIVAAVTIFIITVTITITITTTTTITITITFTTTTFRYASGRWLDWEHLPDFMTHKLAQSVAKRIVEEVKERCG